jgi:hypothetical protein
MGDSGKLCRNLRDDGGSDRVLLVLAKAAWAFEDANQPLSRRLPTT